MTFFGRLLYPFPFPNRIRYVVIKGKVSSMPWRELWLLCTNFHENSSVAIAFFGHLLYPFRLPSRIRNVVIKGKVSSMPWRELWLFMHQFSRKLRSCNEVLCTSALFISFSKWDKECNYEEGFIYSVEWTVALHAPNFTKTHQLQWRSLDISSIHFVFQVG